MQTTTHRAPSVGLLATEPLRALLDHLAARVASLPHPQGDGHAVIVYPGLGGGAMTTARLRKYLGRCNFDAHDWEGGVNTGPEGGFDEWLAPFVERVRALQRLRGLKVSLVGWSLGGIYAREIARLCPEAVRQVVTLGTPFGALAQSNHAGALFQLLNRDRAQKSPQLEERLRTTPPVPTTSVFSKADGIVSWQGCIEKRSPISESVEVDASHLGMGTHPQVLRIVANRLAQAEGRWRPLRRSERLAR
jgi:hypothetical protein